MKKTLLCACMAFAAVFSLFAYSAEEVVNPSYWEQLQAQGVVQKQFYKKGDSSIILAPKTVLGQRAAQSWPQDAERPIFIMENLYILKKADLGSNSSKMNIDFVSKLIRSISKMEGMQYYSHSDKKTKTLYKDCYRIAGPSGADSKVRLPDDTEGSADGKVFYCMQNDASFGKMYYELRYHQTANETSAEFINVSPIYFGPIKAVNTNNMRIGLSVTDCGDSFVVYMIIQGKFPALSIIENTMNESFSSRLDAIYKWFVSQFD